ncbi:MAG: M14 family metallopeptidase [Chloroflexota bacterium]
MPSHRKRTPILLVLVWGVNALGALFLGGLFLFYWLQNTAQPIPSAPPPVLPSVTPVPSLTPPPTRYYLPTITPNPRSTAIVFESPTPFIFSNTSRAQLIGLSVSGRPIEVYTFGNGGRQVMIVAGIHGGYEWNTIALADQMILYLNDHPEIIPQDITLYILRNLNPDGDARDHGIDGRVNDHGVDLNRNFPVNWSATWERAGCFDLAPTTSGISPGSEPETLAVMNFLMSHRVEALISYHSAGLGIFPGGEPWDEASMQLAQRIDDISDYPYPPVETGCTYTGTLADYAVSRGAAAVDLELSDHTHTEFGVNLRVLGVLLHFKK